MSNGKDEHGDNHNASLQRVDDNARAQLDEARKDIHRLQVEADRITTLYSEAYRRADDMLNINARLRNELKDALRDRNVYRDNAKLYEVFALDAERLARQLAQAQAERDAARAEVARLTAALTECCAALYGARELTGNIGNIVHAIELALAALRQPAPARLLDDGMCECGHSRGQHRTDNMCMIFPCKCMEYNDPATAPAGGEAK